MVKKKLSWKEKTWRFFRPNKLKLIIFGILIILSLVSYVLSEMCPVYWEFDEPGSRCSHLEDLFGLFFIFLPLLPFLIFESLFKLNIILPDYFYYTIVVFYYLIFYYVLACIAYYLYILIARIGKVKSKRMLILLLFVMVNLSLANAITDTNSSNNMMNKTINVSSTLNLSFNFIQVVFSDEEEIADFEDIVKNHVDFINRTYPLSDQISYKTSEKFISKLGDYDWTLLLDVALKAKIAKIKEDRIIGIFPSYKDYLGLKFIGIERTVIAREDSNTTTAHEIGHTYGLCDEYDVSTWNFQDGYFLNLCPNAGDGGSFNQECVNTSTLDGANYHGCPVENKGVIEDLYFSEPPTYLINLMGARAFGGNTIKRWIDVESYNILLDKLTTNNPPVFEEIDYVIVSGYVNRSGSIKLREFYTVDGGFVSNQNDFNPGNISLQVKDNVDNTVFKINFTPVFEYMDYSGNITEVNESPFLIVVPYENSSSFQFFEETTLKVQRNVTPNTPTVNITYPTGGKTLTKPFNITWTATDADGDNIYYAILISDDGGGNFTTLDIDLNQTYYELDPDDYDYGSNYVVKILATDGVNTGNNITNAFTLGSPLSITILSPVNNAIYTSTSVDLNWTVDKDIDWCAYSLDGGANNTGICPKQWCYQETSNVSTDCGGLSTGTYGWYNNTDENFAHFYINYTKPVYSTNNSMWQIRFGNYTVHNITIPTDCWGYDNNKLILMFDLIMDIATNGGYCFNGTWNKITNVTNGLSVVGSNQVDYPSHAFDGNYNTGSYFVLGWRNYVPGYESAKFALHEEGIWWNIPALTNITLTGLSEGNHNIIIYANDSAGNMGQSDYVYFIVMPQDPNKFYIKNSTGNNIAWFGDLGNVVLKGILEQNSTHTATANDEFRFQDSNGNDVMLIDMTNGNMYIDGNLSQNQNTLTPSQNSDDFIILNETNNVVAYVNEFGYMFLKGILVENGNP